MNIYESCPTFIGPRLTLRPVREEDAPGLLAVYSDEKAQPFFNADNCTSNFCYTTIQEMLECIAMWKWSYEHGWFVRWTVCAGPMPIGTVELFRRPSQDAYDGCALLRLDLSSRFELEEVIFEILDMLLPEALSLFGCDFMATKVPRTASERMLALARKGFRPCDEPLIGHDGTMYGDYWITPRQA